MINIIISIVLIIVLGLFIKEASSFIKEVFNNYKS